MSVCQKFRVHLILPNISFSLFLSAVHFAPFLVFWSENPLLIEFWSEHLVPTHRPPTQWENTMQKHTCSRNTYLFGLFCSIFQFLRVCSHFLWCLDPMG